MRLWQEFTYIVGKINRRRAEEEIDKEIRCGSAFDDFR